VSGAAPVDNALLDEAAQWLVRLGEGNAGAGTRAEFQRWYQRSAAHQQAWRRAETLLEKLGGVPPELAIPTLQRRLSRRAALARLGAIMVSAPLAWTAWRWSGEQGWRADLRTATGERREVDLPDGSRLTLNTDTAVDLGFQADRRRMRLVRGEILLKVSPAARPLRVDTDQGWLASGAGRILVRHYPETTSLGVIEGRAEVHTGAGGDTVFQGRQVRFSARAAARDSALDAAGLAWTRGMLMADAMPLAHFAAELSRYRDGVLRVDPAVAGLSVSGSYPVTDTDLALTMLAATYPVQVGRHLGGFWVTLAAA
tara:strand:- start:70967 stop:71905 length:939 start_codon:yes stop_codon:yes gene_type:complete